MANGRIFRWNTVTAVVRERASCLSLFPACPPARRMNFAHQSITALQIALSLPRRNVSGSGLNASSPSCTTVLLSNEVGSNLFLVVSSFIAPCEFEYAQSNFHGRSNCSDGKQMAAYHYARSPSLFAGAHFKCKLSTTDDCLCSTFDVFFMLFQQLCRFLHME